MPTCTRFKSISLSGLMMFGSLCGMPAMATLSTPVTVSLIAPGGATGGGFTDPTPVNASQTIGSIGSFINVTNGGPVGSLMLFNEQVFLSGDSIRISSYAGDDTAGVFRTGWLGTLASPARYDFTGLSIAGRTITGFTLFGFDGFGSGGFQGAVAGTTGVAMSDTNADGSLDTLSFNLDALRFVPRTGLGTSEYHADFRIELTSSLITPVPETSSLAMSLAGLGVLGLVTARRKQRFKISP